MDFISVIFFLVIQMNKLFDLTIIFNFGLHVIKKGSRKSFGIENFRSFERLMKVVSTGLYSVIKNKDENTIYGTYYNLNSLEHD